MEIFASVTKLPPRKSNGPSWRIDPNALARAYWLEEFFGRLLNNGREQRIGFTGALEGNILRINFEHPWYLCEPYDGGKRVKWKGSPLVSWDDILQKGNAQTATLLIFSRLK